MANFTGDGYGAKLRCTVVIDHMGDVRASGDVHRRPVPNRYTEGIGVIDKLARVPGNSSESRVMWLRSHREN